MTDRTEIAALCERLRPLVERAFRVVDDVAGEIAGAPNEPTGDAADIVAMELADAAETHFDEFWPATVTAVLFNALDRLANPPTPIDGGPNAHDAALGLVAGHPVGRMAALGITEPVDDVMAALRISDPTTEERARVARAMQTVKNRTFQRGDRVEKINGSSWRGIVVGEYSTGLTPEGYAVESEREPGSVQIYPVKALRLVAFATPMGNADREVAP